MKKKPVFKQFKVTYRIITRQWGETTKRDVKSIYTMAPDEKKAKQNARYRIGYPEREEYLPGDGAFLATYVVEPVGTRA